MFNIELTRDFIKEIIQCKRDPESLFLNESLNFKGRSMNIQSVRSLIILGAFLVFVVLLFCQFAFAQTLAQPSHHGRRVHAFLRG